jgi:diguanylate cyclase (GGDEF)-like protein
MDEKGRPVTRPGRGSLVLQPRRLTQVLIAALAAGAMSSFISLLNGRWLTAVLQITISSMLVFALWLVRKRRIEWAAKVALGTFLLLLSSLIVQSQGLRDEAVLAYPGVLIFASMFAGRRLFLAVLAAMFAVLTGVVVSNTQGWYLNGPGPVDLASLLGVLGILAVTAYFVWIMASDLRRALVRLEVENERMRASHARIDVLAHHDALTGLPNRVLARDRLAQAISVAHRQQQLVGAIFLDLDNFKAVNDSLGHAAGDLLLREVAMRLRANVRDSDTVSRQGGDEFLIIMGGLTDAQAVAATAVKIIDQIAQPFQVNGLEIFSSCSLGIAMYPENGGDFDTLLKNADVAMYRAKDAGRNAFRFYDAEMNTSVVETLHLISGIRTALARGEFRLHYQPQYDLRTGAIVGAEALIRWRHPDLGMIPPTKFIPVAERSGLINEVGAWVLGEACRQAKDWQERGLDDIVVAVNLSPVQFRRDEIEREVVSALAAAGLEPCRIELELTESLLIAESAHLSPLLSRLRGMGIRFSIDDFGTGYSNLGYLKRFEVERLKIDESFVRRMNEDTNDAAIVRAIIEMAHSLRLETVAEGIEDPVTLKRLKELGCEYGQGYHWSPALPPGEFFEFAMRHQPVLMD